MRWIKSVIAIKEFPLLRVKRNFDEIIRFAMKYAVLWFSLFYKNISKVWYEIKTFTYQLLPLKSLTYLNIATLLLSFKYQMSWETYEKRKILFNYILQTYIYRSTRYLNITTKVLDMNLYVEYLIWCPIVCNVENFLSHLCRSCVIEI